MSELNGAVLIGGRSRRMGREKASLLGPDGRTISARIAATLREAGASRVCAVGGERDPQLGLPWLPDLRPGRGPLAGIESALQEGGWWWVVACDLPGVSTADLQRLAAARVEDRPAVAWVEGRCQPLLGLYGPGQLAPVRLALDAGRSRAVETVGTLDPVRVDLGPLANLNTPEEFARWEHDVAGDEASP